MSSIAQSDTAKNPGSAIALTTATSTVAAAQNLQRVEITLCNDNATAVVYLALGPTAAVNSGIRLNAAGGSYTTSAYKGVISAIQSSGAGTVLTVSEV